MILKFIAKCFLGINQIPLKIITLNASKILGVIFKKIFICSDIYKVLKALSNIF